MLWRRWQSSIYDPHQYAKNRSLRSGLVCGHLIDRPPLVVPAGHESSLHLLYHFWYVDHQFWPTVDQCTELFVKLEPPMLRFEPATTLGSLLL